MPDQPTPCACPTPPRHAADCPATADLWPGVAPSGPAGARPGSTGTCDASILGVSGPLGPCILRHQHDGPVHKDTSGATWWPTVKADKQAPDQLAPFRALADRYAAKAAESTRHAKIADDDEKRLATQGIAAGWRSAEFLLRHTLTDLDNHRTTPDNLAALPAQSRRPDLTIRLGKATEETFRIHLAQFGIDTPGCDCGHNEMGVEWHATDCQWRTSRTTPDNPTGSAFPDVRGRCPACRGESLFVGSGGYITCARRECLEPDAASTLLERVPDNIAAEAIAARRRALARNAVGAVLNTHGQWLPLSVREAVADAVLAAAEGADDTPAAEANDRQPGPPEPASEDVAAHRILTTICETNGYRRPPPGIQITAADLAEIDRMVEHGTPFGEAVRDVIGLAAWRTQQADAVLDQRISDALNGPTEPTS